MASQRPTTQLQDGIESSESFAV